MKLELKKKLIADVREKFGPNADPGKVIEYLYEIETLDDGLAKRHMLRVDFFIRMLSTTTIRNQIYQDLAEDYGMTREGVIQTVTR